MRQVLTAVVLVVAAVLPAAGQGAEWSSTLYPVKAVPPAGWTSLIKDATPAGAWLDLQRYEESKTGAKLTLSVQASNYRNGEEMLARLKEQFTKDATLAILRTEAKQATAKQPAFIVFEYTRKGDKGPEHCLAAYWFALGQRYRVYGAVREVGWKTVGADMDRFVQGVSFAGRGFGATAMNFTDEAANFALTHPDDWSVRLPEKGPRVQFASERLGISVWISLRAVKQQTLEDLVTVVVDELKAAKHAVGRQTPPADHPVLNRPVATVEYVRGSGKDAVKCLETLVVHREILYRIVLAGSEANFAGGLDPYDRLVSSLNFLK